MSCKVGNGGWLDIGVAMEEVIAAGGGIVVGGAMDSIKSPLPSCKNKLCFPTSPAKSML